MFVNKPHDHISVHRSSRVKLLKLGSGTEDHRLFLIDDITIPERAGKAMYIQYASVWFTKRN